MITLYKYPGDVKIWGDRYRTKTFSADEIDSALDSGWHDSPQRAKSAYEDRPPSRDEMMQKAKELGLQVPHNISDKKLMAKISHELDKTTNSD